MKVVLLTGSHTRHAYIARCAALSGNLAAVVIEERENSIPAPPDGLDAHMKCLFKKHFDDRLNAEEKFFGRAEWPDTERLAVAMESLNNSETIRFVNRFNPDLLLSYGVHKLNPDFLKESDAKFKWNIHGGLSPWYRGVTTHFWPSYFLEPQMTGMTVHELTQDIDGGGVIHQTAAELIRGDGIHDLACRAVMSLGEVLPRLFSTVRNGTLGQPKAQTTSGRIWRGIDWRPEHLSLIYDFYGNRIVDSYLDGVFEPSAPKLAAQF